MANAKYKVTAGQLKIYKLLICSFFLHFQMYHRIHFHGMLWFYISPFPGEIAIFLVTCDVVISHMRFSNNSQISYLDSLYVKIQQKFTAAAATFWVCQAASYLLQNCSSSRASN